MSALTDKAVVVTGAGRGLGRAYAELAAAEGARVVVNDIDRECADEVVAAIGEKGGEALASHDDIGSWDGAAALIQRCIDGFGRLDGLINNAGLFYMAKPDEEEEKRVEAIVRVNVLGSAFCGIHALRVMMPQNRGSIVNITSGAHAGIASMGMYGATKGAAASMTYAWAMDVADTDVRVNAVSPVAKSRMYDTMRSYSGATGRSTDTTITPEDNAAVAVYLLSDAAAGVNGQVVRIAPPNLSLVAHPSEAESVASCERWTVDEVARAFDREFRGKLEPLGLSAWGARFVS